MKRRYIPQFFLTASTAVAVAVFAVEPAKTPDVKPAYSVTLELSVDEQGVVEATRVVASDDKILDVIAEQMAKEMKLPVRQKDGAPVKYKVLAPLTVPVEGDGGPEAQKGPMPKLILEKKFALPVFPFDLREEKKGGGAILQLRIDTQGRVAELKTIRASNQAYAKSAEKAVRRWRFEPAQADGQPVEVVRYLAVVFEINGAKAELQWYLAPRPCLETFTVSGTLLPANEKFIR